MGKKLLIIMVSCLMVLVLAASLPLAGCGGAAADQGQNRYWCGQTYLRPTKTISETTPWGQSCKCGLTMSMPGAG